MFPGSAAAILPIFLYIFRSEADGEALGGPVCFVERFVQHLRRQQDKVSGKNIINRVVDKHPALPGKQIIKLIIGVIVRLAHLKVRVAQQPVNLKIVYFVVEQVLQGKPPENKKSVILREKS